MNATMQKVSKCRCVASATADSDSLRSVEIGKIRCGERHFEALESDVQFGAPVRNWQEFKLSV